MTVANAHSEKIHRFMSTALATHDCAICWSIRVTIAIVPAVKYGTSNLHLLFYSQLRWSYLLIASKRWCLCSYIIISTNVIYGMNCQI